MPTQTETLFNRPDTFLGVCEGLGQDLGFNPLLARIAFAGLLFWSPVGAVAIYAGLGVVVHSGRWLFPVRNRKAAGTDVAPTVDTAADVTAQNDTAPAPDALAA